MLSRELKKSFLYKVTRCWCGYLAGERCRLFAYGPADATASQNPTKMGVTSSSR